MSTPLQRFFKLLQADKREIYLVYAYAAFNGIVNLSLPLGIQAIIGFIMGGMVSFSWILLVFLVIVGIAVTGGLQVMQMYLVEILQQRVFTRAALEFAFRIPRFKLESLRNRYAPEIINRFFDTISVQKGLGKVLIEFSTSALQVVFGLILLSFYHPFFVFFGLMVLFIV